MEQYSHNSLIHIRIRNFISWIAPEKETRDEIKKQSNEIRKKIKAKAEEDGLIISSMPYSGSFAKKTGLRRHLRGDSDVEGQDVDIAFVVRPDKETEFEPLIERFIGYCEKSYPNTNIEVTKSSIKLSFSSTKLSYDIVPMFSTSDPEKQILLRNNGDKVRTSVQKHTVFARRRTKDSDEEKGIVTYNNCLRAVKWWRYFKIQNTQGAIDDIPSFLLDLLVAKAYDELSVNTTYPQTLANWFNYLAQLIKSKKTVWFKDYYAVPRPDTSLPWNVLDPVMAENNIVKNWPSYQVDELADWFQEASEILNRAIVADLMGEDNESLEHLAQLFGKIFKSHC